MQEICRRLGIEHDFSTPYCAWANGGIERVMRDIKALMRIICLENRVDKLEWPKLIPNVMHAINQRPSTVLDWHTPA